MADISPNNPFTFCHDVDCVNRRTLLEAFCKTRFSDQTVIFLCGNDIDEFRLRVVGGGCAIDGELLQWLQELRELRNIYWITGQATVPVVVRDCDSELADKLRAAVYNDDIEALWHNNSLDHYTD